MPPERSWRVDSFFVLQQKQICALNGFRRGQTQPKTGAEMVFGVWAEFSRRFEAVFSSRRPPGTLGRLAGGSEWPGGRAVGRDHVMRGGGHGVAAAVRWWWCVNRRGDGPLLVASLR